MGLWSAFVSRIPLRLLASGTPVAGQVPTALSATRAEWQTPSAAGGPATQIQESSGPTTLTLGAVADGEVLTRVGTTLVGAAAGGGGGAPVGASYVVIGLDATLSADRKLTAGTGVTLTDGGANGNATIAADIGTGAGQVASATDSRLSDDRPASGLRSATTVVAVSAAVAPSSGQVLTATSSTAASWQTPSGGAGADMTVLDWLGW